MNTGYCRSNRRAVTTCRGAVLGACGLAVAFGVMSVATRGNTNGWNAVDDITQALVAAVASAACALAARRQTGRLRLVWILLAVGAGLWFAGQVCWSSAEIPSGVPPPTPSFDDLGFLGASACYTAAVIVILDSAARRLTRMRAVVESLLLAASVLFVSWIAVLRSIYGQTDGPIIGRLVTLAYPISDVIVISVLLFALARAQGPGRRWIEGLAVGIGAIAVADSVFTYMDSSARGYTGVQPNDTCWVVGFLLVALVALGSRSPAGDEADAQPTSLVRSRLMRAFPSLSALAVVVGFFVQRAFGGSMDSTAVFIAMTVLSLGVAWNLSVIFENDALSARLAVAVDEAVAGSRMKSEFLANMSHEIRTPMNAVIGLTALLLETELDDQQRQFADGVATSAEGLLGIINDILDFSKIEAGKLVVETIDLNLDDLIYEVATVLADAARRKNLELVAYCEPGLAPRRRGDPVRLRQVLLNLASNAIKFTTDGQVIIRALPSAERPDEVCFEVADTGIGIPPADHDRLFEAFSQADASTTRKFGGTGLGLTIVRRLTELQGGTITLESQENIGTTFRVTVPLPEVSHPAAEDALDSWDGLTALVVDDNAVSRLVLAHSLRNWGFVVDEAASPADGLDLFARARSSGPGYALALLDYLMPEMNGIELAQALGRQHPGSATTLVLISSAPDVSHAEAREAGIAAVIVRPLRNADLLGRIMSALVPQAQPEPVSTH